MIVVEDASDLIEGFAEALDDPQVRIEAAAVHDSGHIVIVANWRHYCYADVLLLGRDNAVVPGLEPVLSTYVDSLPADRREAFRVPHDPDTLRLIYVHDDRVLARVFRGDELETFPLVN